MSRPAAYGIYILTLNLVVIAGFIYLFRYPESSTNATTCIGTIAIFKNYLVEMSLVSALGIALINGSVLPRIIAYLIFGTYSFVNILQLLAYYIGDSYFTWLAFENVTHISFIISARKVVLLTIVFLLLFFMIVVTERLKPCNWRLLVKNVAAITLLCNLVLIWTLWLPNKIQHYCDQFYKLNHVSNYSPFMSFVWLFLGRTESMSLSKGDLLLAQSLGCDISYGSRYPVVKNWIYRTQAPFPVRPMAEKKPNIIVIFAEGMSERLLALQKSSNLMPYISDFSSHKNTMVVSNYFNHTAATYHALEGQLCSFWPILQNPELYKEACNFSQPKHFSLAHYLTHQGYKTHFFYSQRRDSTYLDELAESIGFADVATGEDLSRRFLSNAPFKRENCISDHQLFEALKNFVQTPNEWNNQPFFLALYNFETHAFVDVGDDGIKFMNGDNSVLNSTHNFDSAFGVFWKEFLASDLAHNTIIIFTADHAHYPEKPFVDVVAANDPTYQHVFFDKIPLIIYDPTRKHPKEFNARYRSSIDFVPSLIHYLGFPNTVNPFMGVSIFENPPPKRPKIAFASISGKFYWADNNGTQEYVPHVTDNPEITSLNKLVRYLTMLDKNNSIWSSTLIK